ncbi:N-formylglutamate amidohydrolase [Candidatus Falkowbacteria bacterium]|nr:N-formylglutamate amidohydrolase [Candidatus Falkowbacteria bacterium]
MPQPPVETPAYLLSLPSVRRSGVVFSSPHSGCDYGADFLARTVLDGRLVRSSEDAFVDRLLTAVPREGAVLIAARAPRAYVDLNRGPDELDPTLIEGVRAQGLNPRVTAGLGVIPRVVAGGRAIYSGKLTRAEAEARIARYWRPYHARLAALLAESRARFGRAVLIDVHSMPREAIESLGHRRPEIVLGDRFGAAAGAGVVAAVEAAFEAEGLRVGRNAPFAGAYIAQAYGKPAQGSHVVQVEIDRSLYMNETTISPRADFAAFCALMGRVVARIAAIDRDEDVPLAAE